MKHKMRRFKQLLPNDLSIAILKKSTNGILSLADNSGEPYGVPLSYVYDGGNHIYFHSAVSGHKIDCITHESRCSFCVVEQDMIIPEEFTTYFRSVIVKGKIKIVSESDEIQKALLLLCEKYSPAIDSTAEITKCISHVAVLRLDIEDITGKEAIELVRERNSVQQ